MEFQTYVAWISNPVQIAFLDLILGADNAIIIALVCRTLPRYQRLNVMVVGTGAALLLRVVLTALTGTLMALPLIRIVGGLVLMLIAISLTDEVGFLPKIADRDDDAFGARDKQADSEAFWDAILLVVLADGIMSLDNTVALAAVAKGEVIFLVIGLLLSVPTLVFGSWMLSELLGDTPLLSRFAMAVLGWVAGDMAVSDPLVASWINTQAPALVYAVPLAVVLFVLAKVAMKPIIVPAVVLESIEYGSGGTAEAAEEKPARIEALVPVIEIVPEVVVVAELVSASEPVHAVAPVPVPTPDTVFEVTPVVTDVVTVTAAAVPVEVAADAIEIEPADDRPGMSPMTEKIILGGFIALFAVAAILISVAIYFGAATF